MSIVADQRATNNENTESQRIQKTKQQITAFTVTPIVRFAE